jgi:hypothetical protein
MPSIESIDKLKKLVQGMGDEPAIRQKMGMPMEDITPPASSLDPDISSLLGDGAPGVPGDMDSFLGQRISEDPTASTSIPQDDLLDAFADVPEEPPGSSFDEVFAPDQEALAALGLAEGEEGEPGGFDPLTEEFPQDTDPSESFDLDDALGALGAGSEDELPPQEDLGSDLDSERGALDDTEAAVGSDDLNLDDEPSATGLDDEPVEELEMGPDLGGSGEGEEEYVDAFGEDDPLAGFGDFDAEEEQESPSSTEDDLFDDLPEPDEDFGEDEDDFGLPEGLTEGLAEEGTATPETEEDLEGDFAADDFMSESEALLAPDEPFEAPAEDAFSEKEPTFSQDLGAEPTGDTEEDLPEDTFEFGEAEDSFEIGEPEALEN